MSPSNPKKDIVTKLSVATQSRAQRLSRSLDYACLIVLEVGVSDYYTQYLHLSIDPRSCSLKIQRL